MEIPRTAELQGFTRSIQRLNAELREATLDVKMWKQNVKASTKIFDTSYEKADMTNPAERNMVVKMERVVKTSKRHLDQVAGYRDALYVECHVLQTHADLLSRLLRSAMNTGCYVVGGGEGEREREERVKEKKGLVYAIGCAVSAYSAAQRVTAAANNVIENGSKEAEARRQVATTRYDEAKDALDDAERAL